VTRTGIVEAVHFDKCFVSVIEVFEEDVEVAPELVLIGNGEYTLSSSGNRTGNINPERDGIATKVNNGIGREAHKLIRMPNGVADNRKQYISLVAELNSLTVYTCNILDVFSLRCR